MHLHNIEPSVSSTPPCPTGFPHQHSVEQSDSGGVPCDPQGHQVPAQLPVGQETIVNGGGEERGVEMAG